MKYPHFTVSPPSSGMIAHRGVSALAPENTLASFRLAAAQHIDWVEFDLRLTKDNVLVIFHDDDLDRTTNGSGFIHEKSWEELKRLDAGSWFSQQYQNETIPVFSESIRELLNLNLNLNIELKLSPQASPRESEHLIQQLVQILKAEWPSHRHLPLISSFHWELLNKIRRIYPQIPIGFLQDECTMEALNRVAAIPNAAFHCHFQSISQEMLKAGLALKVPLLAYTVNSPEIAEKLFHDGIFAIFADNPIYLLNTLIKRNPSKEGLLK